MAPRKPKKEAYGNQSISALKGADRVRKRPGVIFGSNGLEGCEHAVFEILSNAIDEAREGHGDLIVVTRYADKSIEVEDFGRGCPVDWNESEGRFNWELVFCELYAGGKYGEDGDNYEYSLGLNGLGSCATQYASEYFDATIYRDGQKYTLHFEKGENIGGLHKEPAKHHKTGSKFRWKPDLAVFTDIDIPAEYYQDTMKRQAVVNAGVTFRFRNQVGDQFETTEYRYDTGIVEYVTELAGENPLTQPVYFETERVGRDREDLKDYKVKLSVAFCFSNTTSIIEHYHNSSWLEHGGSPEKAVRSAFVSALDSYLKKQGKYNKNESKVTFGDVQDSLILVSNNFSTATSYENQTKKSITNRFVQEAMTEFLRSSLEVYFIENPSEAEKIAGQILINKRSRETAEKARGKILNCLKADYNRIFKSEIITDLLRVMGCGVELKGVKKSKDLTDFDLDRLRWNKIIICTDADVDGYQIRTLILTMLYRLTPTLIEEGYVYIAESPLYEINYKEQTWFAYSDKEKNDIVAGELAGKKVSIQRSKGLGENEPDMMWMTTMNPASRRLIKVMPEEAAATAMMFDLLLGDNLAGRKSHIAQHGHEFLELADLS